MPYCCAVNCHNGTGSGRSFYLFPKEEKRRKEWSIRVKGAEWKPGKYAYLCSDHFAADAFVKDPQLVASLGLTLGQNRLKPDAVPSIFNHGEVKKERHSSAVTKRRKLEVLTALPRQSSTDSDSEGAGECEMNQDVEVAGPSTSTTIGTQTEYEVSNKMVQTLKDRQPKKSTFTRATQTVADVTHTSVQVVFEGHSAATQYDPPPLDEEEEEEEDAADDDPDWHMSESDESDGSNSGGEEDHEDSVKEELNDKFTPYERKFIVYGSCLRELLVTCLVCLCQCTVQVKRVFGSMIAVEQLCTNGHRRVWESQPRDGTKGLPYGNLMLASSILFSGSSPARVLNLLRHLNVPCISQRSYNLIQSSYLVTAVKNVWRREQEDLLKNMKGVTKLGGDARCCSPGHTAKFSSYTLMDLTRAKVVDLQHIQASERN